MSFTIQHWAAMLVGFVLMQANLVAWHRWATRPEPPRAYGWLQVCMLLAALVLPLLVYLDTLSGRWTGAFLWYLGVYFAYPALLGLLVVYGFVIPRRRAAGWPVGR